MSERMFEVNVPGPSGQLPLACTWSNGKDALESMRAFVALGYTPFALTSASGITERLDIGQMEEIFADQSVGSGVVRLDFRRDLVASSELAP